MTTIPNLIPDHHSSPIHKTLFTGYLCGLSMVSRYGIGSFVGGSILQGCSFGLLAKTISVITAHQLDQRFGARKTHELFADIVGGLFAYGTFHYIFASSLSLTSIALFTACSLGVTLITIKVVYVAFSTFFFYAIDNNGLLDKIGNYLSQPLFQLNFANFVKIIQFVFENPRSLIAKSAIIINPNVPIPLISESIEFLFDIFSSRNILKTDTIPFQNEHERFNFLTQLNLLEFFNIPSIRPLNFAVIIHSIKEIYTLIMRGQLHTLETLNFSLFVFFYFATYFLDFPFSPTIRSCLTFVPFVGLLFKASALILDPSARKKYWDVFQWQLKENGRTSPPRLQERVFKEIRPKERDPDETHSFLRLPDEMILEIAIRLKKEEDLYQFFASCRRFLTFGSKKLESQEIMKSLSQDHFPSEFDEVLKKLNLRSLRKMKAVLLKAQFANGSSDIIQHINSIVVEGGFESMPGRPVFGGHAITTIDTNDMGEQIAIWGYKPIPFIAIQINYNPNRNSMSLIELALNKTNKVQKGILLFHRCGEVNGSELWGISDPNSTKVQLATDEAQMKKLLEHLQTLLQKAQEGSNDPIPLPLAL